MNTLKKITILTILLLFTHSCADYKVKKKITIDEKKYFSSSGFALIYHEKYYKDKVINKRLDNSKLLVMHSFLKKNTPIKIINPENSKSIETKVYNKAEYPNIFNIIITESIATVLDIDRDNPFVEIIEIKKNKKFIAKEGNTFEEERNVAEKAPVDEIKMDDLSIESSSTKASKKEKSLFVLVISDFYYMETANELMKDLKLKTKLKNIHVEKINNNKYRLFVGPFKNFNALKTTYISLNNLGFDDLNIYKN